MNSYPLTYPRPLLEDRVTSRLAGLGSNKCPSVISSKTVITRMATRWQDIFIPHWLLAPHRLSVCCFSGCKRVENDRTHTQRFLSHYFFAISLLPTPRSYPNPFKSTLLMISWSEDGLTLRKQGVRR